MVRTVCKHCGYVMYDDESSIRFKCVRCQCWFDLKDWYPKLHQQIQEALEQEEEKNEL